MSIKAVVITVSDRSYSGEREDKSGPVAVNTFRDAGFDCGDAIVIPDGIESVSNALTDAISQGARVIFTTGGTGVSARDVTPEATRPFIEKELSGIETQIVLEGLKKTELSGLSRGIVGVGGKAIFINAPGSRGGVKDALSVVLPLIPHLIEQLDGYDGEAHQNN
ncbi:molybdenum cofactor synthesis domain-containing protein [Corynebacterium pyruviciproducens ATCC BAA-1742]|uniref:Molybdenum cofactor synthesis domain-containing protein n=1 Tax=Corynebacterium pyruviciproducens ATCC BAA-1742 TaxID=1125779 RepID=S2Z2K7_9CORY|nr:MogA/MoaB family molybdenum cofactor biosynthesis protein [Corynebacterium pyruviciproducens]EPD71018.1 molybdenum cofactor synthesis domain-containing protein [Corynebacterium pyruviciproducens ATCC BAA-1742]